MRYHRSSRNVPSRTIAARSRCVAATTRTLTRIGFAPPTRSTKPSCSTRKKPHLRIQRQLADFIQEQRAHVGPLEPALPRFVRAGEAALLVAEQLRVDQLARNRAAIDAQERPAVPVAAIVNRARNQLLAGARFAQDQHRHFGAAHQVDALHHLRQTRTLRRRSFRPHRCGPAGAAAIAARPRPLRAARPARAAGRRCRAQRAIGSCSGANSATCCAIESLLRCGGRAAARRASRARRRAARAANRRRQRASRSSSSNARGLRRRRRPDAARALLSHPAFQPAPVGFGQIEFRPALDRPSSPANAPTIRTRRCSGSSRRIDERPQRHVLAQAARPIDSVDSPISRCRDTLCQTAS